jgi:hypothetical protein
LERLESGAKRYFKYGGAMAVRVAATFARVVRKAFIPTAQVDVVLHAFNEVHDEVYNVHEGSDTRTAGVSMGAPPAPLPRTARALFARASHAMVTDADVAYTSVTLSAHLLEQQ